jgi:hypothetical protein
MIAPMVRQSRVSSAMIVFALVACGKGSSEKKEAAPTPPAATGSSAAGSGSAAASEPTEAAAVVTPTKSATGTIQVAGAMTGSFEWKKKDQRAPITCIWDPEKEIGTLKIDVSDGAGQLLTLGIDIPPSDAGPGRIEVSSKGLPASLKSYSGFKLKGDDPEKFSAVFDGAEVVSDPDAQMAAKADKKKKAEPPSGPQLTLKGELEVTCPKKK